MKTKILGLTIMTLFATMIFLTIPAWGAGFLTDGASGNLLSGNLIGKWTIILTSNGNYDYAWAYLKIDVNERGEASCLQWVGSDGNTECPTLPNISLGPDGQLSTEDGLTYGFMNYDGINATLFSITPDGATLTGSMTRTLEDFDVANLKGRWAVILTSNGNYDYAWAYLKMDVNERGETSCVQWLGSDGNTECPTLPNLSVGADGQLSTEDGLTHGFVSHGIATIHLYSITPDGVIGTGEATRL